MSESEWRIAEEKPGYRCKTVQFGPATCHIYRPIFETPEEETKAHQKVKTDMELALSSYYTRKAREAQAAKNAKTAAV